MKRSLSLVLATCLIIFFSLFLSNCKKPERIIKVNTLEINPVDIQFSQVILKGDIVDIGEGSATDHGILIRKTETSGLPFEKLSLGSTSSKGEYSATFNDPEPGKEYEYKAYASDMSGDYLGERQTFNSLDYSIPEITTKPVTEITPFDASSGGNITSEGGSPIIARGICWSINPDPTRSDSLVIDPNPGPGEFVNALYNLDPGTDYYVRAYAENSIGTAYGDQVTFSTQITLPTVSTVGVGNISAYWAVVGGTLLLDGGMPESERGICYSTSPNCDILDNTVIDNSNEEPFYVQLNNLIPGTKYYARAYATNDVGTSYGEEVSFTTIFGPIIISTHDITNITLTSAISGGTIISDGGTTILERGVCWIASGIPDITKDDRTIDAATTTFPSSLTGLTQNTFYYVRAYAINSTDTVYGEMKPFYTQSLPTVTTTVVTNISRETAESGGNATDQGSGTLEAVGVCWNTTGSPTLVDSATDDGSALGVFVSNLTLLTENTTYYVRAYATNEWGTSYGEEVSFTTDPLGLPTLSLKSLTNITDISVEALADVTDDGGANISNRGVCWNTTGSPTDTDSSIGDPMDLGEFNVYITGLTPSTTYYVRAFATNAFGTEYSNEMVFMTSASPAPLIAYYPFNGDVLDQSGNGNDGTNYGAIPVYDRFGEGVSAMLFDDAYVDCNSPLLPETGDFTLNMWIYPDSLGCNLWGQYKFNIGDRIYGGIDNATGNHFIWHSGDLGNNELETTSALAIKNWYMITVVREGTDLKLYINGVLDDTGILSTNNILQTYNFLIGIHTTDYGLEQGFNGIIDDVRIYGGAITEANITNLYGQNGWTGKLTLGDYDGNVYDVVHIGEQLWMQENLKTTKLNDGTDIPLVTDNTDWYNLRSPGRCWYDNLSINNDTYGPLYNWYTVNTNNICPNGWHVPSNIEWTVLSDYLGGAGISGGKLKESGTVHWNSPNTDATNESLFTALPGGYRVNAAFINLGEYGMWWTSTEGFPDNGKFIELAYDNGILNESFSDKDDGMSIRCVKD